MRDYVISLAQAEGLVGVEGHETPHLFIVHGASPAQQAMRASGVGIQPAHQAALPAPSASARRTADTHLIKTCTASRMLDLAARVKRRL